MSNSLHVAFVGGDSGRWRVQRIAPVRGESLAPVTAVEVLEGEAADAAVGEAADAGWILRGMTSHEHYVTPAEHDALAAKQPPLGRAEATCAALIPVAKSPAWWQLDAGERRLIFEDTSHHIALGLEYLPQIARRLHHGRELGEPFDFLTWFEYAPDDAGAFEQLVVRLRETEEWRYVEREVDIRLAR